VTPTSAVPRPERRLARTLLAAVCALALLVAACGDDDDDGDGGRAAEASTSEPGGAPASPLSLDELAAASGGAPAAAGAGLVELPGPAERTGLPGAGETAASVTSTTGEVTGCCLLVAHDAETRQRGLMEVTDLGGYEGMVFVWDEDTSGGFWMRNTPTPLSIAFFAADGGYVGSYDMEACDDSPDCPVYPSPGAYRFALEVAQGDLARLGVGPGSRLAVGGNCAAAS
jgi:uncharacterized membrane protein (UPF0127 family)